MNVQQAYNRWAHTYDNVENKTRDLEAVSLQQTLSKFHFADVLEIGCGTGKNTQWLLTIASRVTGVDFSAEMLAKARKKVTSANAEFIHADILKEWTFAKGPFDLITFSLVLEHVQDLGVVFRQARSLLKPGGLVYVGELHPFKQYLGSKARFETTGGVFELECFTHHLSDFLSAASNNGLECMNLSEWFDDNDRRTTPRLLTMVFRMC